VASRNVAGRLPRESRMRENLMSGLGRGSRKRGEGYRACSLLHSQDTDLDVREGRGVDAVGDSVFDASMIDALLADAMASGTPIEGVDGLLNQMTKGGARAGVGGRDDP
jgi:hypothetical protein